MRRRQKCRQKQLGGERTLLATANATSRMGQGLIAQKANLQKKCRTRRKPRKRKFVLRKTKRKRHVYRRQNGGTAKHETEEFTDG